MAGQTSDTADFRILSRMLDLINRERQKAGVPAVALVTQLCQAAQAHCVDMVQRGYFSDASPEGVDVPERVRRTGYKGRSAANLSLGPETPDEGLATLLGDPAGLANIKNPAHQHLGVGKHDEAWCVLFAAPFGAATGPDASTAEALLTAVNRERGRVQRMPLRLSEQLNGVAHVHATDMYQRSYVGSRGPDGTSVGDRARKAGFDGRVGAVVIAGVPGADQAVEHWMKEDGSRNNLLGGEYRYLGGAAVHNRWVVVLGTPPLAANASDHLIGAVLELLNRHREQATKRERDRKPFAFSEYLNQAAQEHARDMVVNNYLGAQSPSNKDDDLSARVQRTGFRGATAASFVQGPTTAEAVVDAWLKSKPDLENIMDPKFTEIGVGVAESRWVLVLGAPSIHAVSLVPELTARMLEVLNVERAKALAPPVTINDRLSQAAQGHSEDMARRDFSGSNNPDGEGPAQRVGKVRYPYKSLIEFTSVDVPSAEKVMQSWMQGPSHRSHLLSKDFVHIGIGVADSRWTVILAKPQ